MIKRTLAIVAVLCSSLLLATPALASQSSFGDSPLTKDRVTWYTTARTVTVSGSNIYVQKTDGPAIDVKWYKCGNTGISGAWYYLQNADPTPRTRIGTNFAVNTKFCLAAWDHGTNATDTWRGTVWWNVFS